MKILKEGSGFVIQASPSVIAFIEGLQELAKQQFPVEQVTFFLQAYPFHTQDIAPYVFYRADRYTRNLIYKTEAFELLLLCWRQGHKSPIHGHEGEKCWMRVEHGSLRFMNYTESPLDGALQEISSFAGSTGFVDGPAVIHAVEHVGSQEAYSLHLYARPFAQCDVYVDQGAQRRRVDLSYDSMYGVKR